MCSHIYYNITRLLCFSLILCSFYSCQKNKSDELVTFNSFLETNHTFNTITLNHYRAIYFQKRREIPPLNSEKLNTIDFQYEQFLSKIDHSITSKSLTIEPLVQEYNQLLIDIKSLLANYYRKQFESSIIAAHDLNFSNEYHLKAMRNSLTLSMMYAYKSFNGNLISSNCWGFSRIRIKSVVDQYENSAKITLTSGFIQTLNEEKNISVAKIVLDGIDQKMKYSITENHDFTDIILDSLRPGTYEIEGIVQYFDRNGKTAIPFHEAFEVK